MNSASSTSCQNALFAKMKIWRIFYWQKDIPSKRARSLFIEARPRGSHSEKAFVAMKTLTPYFASQQSDQPRL